MITNLSRLILPENIALDLAAADKKQLFDKVALLLATQCALSAESISQCLLAREKLASTGLGHGVAIPHGRMVGLKAPVAAFVRLAEPLPFDAPDGIPVNLMIVLLMPDSVTQKHLEILSEVAELFSSENLRDELTHEKSPAAVHSKLVGWKPSYAR